MIKLIAECDLNTRFGTFHEYLYSDGKTETIAMVMGDIAGEESVLCRLHSSCLHGHAFNSIECTCREEMEEAQKMIQQEGKGVIVWMEQEGKGNGHYALLKSIEFKRQGMKQPEAYEAAGFSRDARDFSAAAKIIKDLGLKSIRLLSSSEKKIGKLKEQGIQINETIEL